LRLYESAWFTAYDLTMKEPGELRVLVRDSIPFPFLTRDKHGFVICLPNLKKLGDKQVGYQRMNFDLEDENHSQIIWSLFMSSICYLSLYTVASNVNAYAGYVEGKDEDAVLNAINIVEDVMINSYLKTFHRTFVPEIMFADAVSYLLLKPAEHIRNEGVRLATSILSLYKTGMIKGSLPKTMLKDVVNIVGMLRALDKATVKAYSEIKNKPDDSDKEAPYVNDDLKTKVFREIYGTLRKHSNVIPEVPSFLYMNHPTRTSIFYSNLEPPPEEKITAVLNEMTRKLGFKVNINLNRLKAEAAQNLWDWMSKERKKEKILAKYKEIGADTRFKEFVFPPMDYAEFLRRKSAHSKTIRRITNRLAVYYNLTGEDFRRETGVIDLQQAIQVIASQSRRSDIFMEDTLRYRGQSWAILVDVSLSLEAFAGQVKDVILCLSEVSRKLFHDNRSLGIFAFDDKFYVIKDFTENHSRSVCARIGGIEHSGLTYLPDGIKTAAKALKKQYEESKILIVVSDGFPTGYKGVVEETKEQVKEALRSGLHVMGIGIDSEGVKDFFPMHCVVKTPYELMKKFVDTFFRYTSLM